MGGFVNSTHHLSIQEGEPVTPAFLHRLIPRTYVIAIITLILNGVAL